MALDRIVPGGAWSVRFAYASGDAYDVTAALCVLTLDAPDGSARITKTYNPAGGSSTGVSVDGDGIIYTLSATDTETMKPGKWVVYVQLGSGPSVPVPTAPNTVTVENPPYGAL